MRAVLISLFVLLLLAVAAGIAYYFIDNQQAKTEQTIRAYSVENAGKKAQLIAVQLDNRLTAAQKSIDPLAQLLSGYDVWNYDVANKLRPVIADRNAGLASLGFAFNAAYRKDYPYFSRTADTLRFEELANDYWEQPWYKNTLNANKTQWTDLYFGENGLEVFYSKQIKTRDGYFVKGVLRANVLLDKLVEEKQDTTTLTYLIEDWDSSNSIISFSEKDSRDKRILEKILQKESNAQAFISGKEPLYIAFAPMQTVDWTVAVVVQNNEKPAFHIGTFMQEHKKQLIISAVAFLFVLFFILFFISRRSDHIDHRRIRNRMDIGR